MIDCSEQLPAMAFSKRDAISIKLHAPSFNFVHYPFGCVHQSYVFRPGR
jgi:hypothetical protein